MYEIGEYIVKPINDGVCKVADIMHLNMTGTDKNKLYYLLIPIDDAKGKIYLPTDTAEATTRRAMTEDEALKLISKIPEIEEISIDDEKLREQKYKEAVRSCNPEALIAIIKMTYLRKKKRQEQGKKHTVVDERYFKMAEDFLYSELEFALNKNKDEIVKLIADTIQI